MISVVIPTLNAAATLPKCFDSLMGAALHGLVREVIVVDGGSSDDTRAIADAAGARFLESERGRGQQLAAGSHAARGGVDDGEKVFSLGRQAGGLLSGADESQ